jgi:hypothetical protein
MVVLDLVTDALRQITVIGQTATPSAEQGQDAVKKLNDLMASLAEDGIDFGYNPKSTTADTIELPLGHVQSIQALLGVALCDGYGIPVPLVVGTVATSGYSRMLRQAIYNEALETRTDAPRGDSQHSTHNIETGG